MGETGKSRAPSTADRAPLHIVQYDLDPPPPEVDQPPPAEGDAARNSGGTSGGGPLPVFPFPRADGRLDIAIRNIADTLAANPARFHLTAEQAQQLAELADAYHAAYILVQSPARSSPETTERKNLARDAAAKCLREIIQQIRTDPRIPSIDKYDLGFVPAKPRADRSREPIDSQPILSVVITGDGWHKLTYADVFSPGARRKPPGVKALEVRIVYARNAVNTPDEAVGQPFPPGTRTITRSPFVIEHPREAAGLSATYFGRWTGTHNRRGAWSSPVSMTVAVAG